MDDWKTHTRDHIPKMERRYEEASVSHFPISPTHPPNQCNDWNATQDIPPKGEWRQTQNYKQDIRPKR